MVPSQVSIWHQLSRRRGKLDKDSVFKVIQRCVRVVPLVLIGSGGTIPHGLPSMPELAAFLVEQLDTEYATDAEWCKFRDRLAEQQGLETALVGLNLSEQVMESIKKCTWQLVSKKDFALFDKVVAETEPTIALGELLKFMYEPHPQQVNVVTTNYDRTIEYACDQTGLPVNDLCSGVYLKKLRNGELHAGNKTVNLLKVHGSLDWFEDGEGDVRSIPLQKTIPAGMKPKIIPPGPDKYRSALRPPCHEVIHLADDLIAKSQGFLCVGYGFNDEQIQNGMVREIRQGKPVVVVTKKMSDASIAILSQAASLYVVIQESDEEGHTDFLMKNGERTSLEGSYWKVREFLTILC